MACGEVGLVLLHHVAVGGRVVDVAEQLQLAVGLLDGVGHDRGVGEAGVVLAGDDRGSGVALRLVLVDRDRLLARGRAVLKRVVMSSTWTVAFWTAIRLPQALSGSTLFGLPFFVDHCVPARSS